MELPGYISTADVNSLISIYPNVPSDVSEKAYRLRFMHHVCQSLPKEFDLLYLGDEIEVKKRINALIISITKRPIMTYMNAIMIILFADGHLSEDDLVKYLLSYKVNIIKRWINADRTTNDAFLNMPTLKDVKRRPAAYGSIRMKKDLYNKGFLLVLAKVLYLNGTEDLLKDYEYGNKYSYYYIYGVIKGFAANDGKIILTTDRYGVKRQEDSLYKNEIPGFFQTITSPKFDEKVFRMRVSEFSEFYHAVKDIFEPFLIDPRGIDGEKS